MERRNYEALRLLRETIKKKAEGPFITSKIFIPFYGAKISHMCPK
jgi:hypothetical protein